MTHDPQPGYEREPFEQEDLSPRAILAFLVGLAVVCVLVFFVLKGMYWALDRYDQAHQPAQNPLASDTSNPEARRAVPRGETSRQIQKTFPDPRLEENERGELKAIRLSEEERLNSFGWVDEKNRVAHIPIDRAMQLIAQRGLPVHPQAGNTPPSVVNTARQAAAKADQSAKPAKPQEKQP